MRKIMDMLNMDNWANSQFHNNNNNMPHDTPKNFNPTATTISKNERNYEIPSTPTYNQRLQIETDFPYTPFIKHCATNYSPNTTNLIVPNMNEQHQILCYIDSFNESLLNIESELDINDLHIYTESVKFNYRNNRISEPMTFINFCPYTKTGKKAKFPVSIVFSTEENCKNYSYTAIRNYETGRIDFMKDGNIGKTRITFFRTNSIYEVHYKMFGISLIADKVTEVSRIDGRTTEIYRNKSTF